MSFDNSLDYHELAKNAVSEAQFAYLRPELLTIVGDVLLLNPDLGKIVKGVELPSGHKQIQTSISRK